MDGWVRVLRPFNSISVISRRWKSEHERLCAMKRRLGSGRISPPAGFEPATPWSEVGSANRSATRTLHIYFGGKGVWRGCFILFYLFIYFFNPMGSWILWKCIIFCRWWSFSKMQFVQMGSVGMRKKRVPIFRRGLSREKWVMRVPWWWCWLISWPYHR